MWINFQLDFSFVALLNRSIYWLDINSSSSASLPSIFVFCLSKNPFGRPVRLTLSFYILLVVHLLINHTSPLFNVFVVDQCPHLHCVIFFFPTTCYFALSTPTPNTPFYTYCQPQSYPFSTPIPINSSILPFSLRFYSAIFTILLPIAI